MVEESDVLPSVFLNQVGGHSCILKIKDSIIKPLDENEAMFYETVHTEDDGLVKDFLLFLPKYYGVFYQNFQEALISSPNIYQVKRNYLKFDLNFLFQNVNSICLYNKGFINTSAKILYFRGRNIKIRVALQITLKQIPT